MFYKGKPGVFLYTTRHIKKGESLAYDYNAGALNGYPTEDFLWNIFSTTFTVIIYLFHYFMHYTFNRFDKSWEIKDYWSLLSVKYFYLSMGNHSSNHSISYRTKDGLQISYVFWDMKGKERFPQ